MELIFLGSGGGRVNLIKQMRWTGGFRINSATANIHVDPGVGALLRSNGLQEDPLRLDAIIVTHAHIDHGNDVNIMIEGMSGYALKKKGLLIASRNSVDMAHEDRIITRYHLNHCETVFSPKLEKQAEKKEFETQKGKFEIEFIKMKHDEITTFGFKLKIEGKVIGYTSDTEFFTELPSLFKGCDYLIINVLKPEYDGIPDHLETSQAIQIIKESQPKLVIINHFGLAMLRAGPENEARKIQEATGVQTIAAKDGLRIKLDAEGLNEFL